MGKKWLKKLGKKIEIEAKRVEKDINYAIEEFINFKLVIEKEKLLKPKEEAKEEPKEEAKLINIHTEYELIDFLKEKFRDTKNFNDNIAYQALDILFNHKEGNLSMTFSQLYQLSDPKIDTMLNDVLHISLDILSTNLLSKAEGDISEVESSSSQEENCELNEEYVGLMGVEI